MGMLDALLGLKTLFSEGVELISRQKLNFIGFTLEDDPTNERTNITAKRLLPTIVEDGSYSAQPWDQVIGLLDDNAEVVLPRPATEAEQGDLIGVAHVADSNTITITVTGSDDSWELTAGQGLTFMRVNGRWWPIASLNPFPV